MAANPKDVCPTQPDNDQRQKSNKLPLILFFEMTQMLFLADVITTSGFRRDSYTILVIWRRHVPYIVVSFFVEFAALKITHRVL